MGANTRFNYKCLCTAVHELIGSDHARGDINIMNIIKAHELKKVIFTNLENWAEPSKKDQMKKIKGIRKAEIELRVFVHGKKEPVSAYFRWNNSQAEPTMDIGIFLEGCGGIFYDDLASAVEHRLLHLLNSGVETRPGCQECLENSKSKHLHTRRPASAVGKTSTRKAVSTTARSSARKP